MISLLLVIGTLLPTIAKASVLSVILASFRGNIAEAQTVTGSGNVQTTAALEPANNIVPSGTGGGDITIVDDSALVPDEGPSGTIADIEKPKNGTISTYVVRDGDTLASVAKLFNVSPNTILWSNDLKKGAALATGEKLTILPITGIPYTVRKGDTLASIAQKYGGNADEIANYNGVDDASLSLGDQIIIPNGEIAPPPAVLHASTGTKTSAKVSYGTGTKEFGPEPAHNVGPAGSSSQISYYIAPLANYIKTQGIHGYNAVDLAAPTGTTIRAAASGDVIVAKSGGWNGGYGSYVVIQHGNGSQTLYGHMSKVSVSVGDHVSQGDPIGAVGATGEATGPHVHFEIRNGIRNPF